MLSNPLDVYDYMLNRQSIFCQKYREISAMVIFSFFVFVVGDFGVIIRFSQFTHTVNVCFMLRLVFFSQMQIAKSHKPDINSVKEKNN